MGKWDVAVIGLPWIRRPGEDLKVNMVAAATSIIAGWGGAMPTVDSSWPALSGASSGPPPVALSAVLNGDLCPVAPCGTRYGKLSWWRPFLGAASDDLSSGDRNLSFKHASPVSGPPQHQISALQCLHPACGTANRMSDGPAHPVSRSGFLADFRNFRRL